MSVVSVPSTALIQPPATLSLQGATETRIAGMERVSDRQLGIRARELRLMHAVRKKTDLHRPGQFKLDAELFDELDIVIVSAQPYRLLMEGPTREKQRPVCASVDTEVPHEQVPTPKAASCLLCDYSQWDRSGIPNKPPRCGENFAFIGLQHGVPDAKAFYFLCRKTAAIAAKQFLRELREMPDLSALHECVIHLTSKEEHGKQGGPAGIVWYTPLFTVTSRIPRERYDHLFELAKSYTYVPPVEASAGVVDDEAPPDVAPAEAEVDDSSIPF